MSPAQQRGLALWAALLSAVVCLSFLPVSRLVSVLFLLAVLGLILALWIVARRRAEHDVALNLDDLPEATYRQPVVLVCGDLPLACMQQSPVLTVTQGCWIRVEEHQDLQQVARQILGLRPDWGRQLSVMVSVCPQKHADSERLTRRLLALRWQISQLRKETGHSVPLVLNGQVGSAMTNDLLWQAVIPGEGVRVWRASSAPGSVAAWVTTGGAPAMQQQVLMNSLMSWFRLHVKAVFIDESPDVPVIAPVAVLWGLGPILAGSLATSVWTAWLSRLTAMQQVAGWQPVGTDSTVIAALPDFILSLLPEGRGLTPRGQAFRYALAIFTLAAMAALLSSGWNNRQLLQRVSFDIARYERIPMQDFAPKADAVAVLRDDAAGLDDQARNGVPMRMGLGLYQGERLRMPVLDAIRSYVPPPPPPKPQPKPVPKIVRLDSMSLFDSGKSALKAGSTKMLVNSLVGIKAKPGWLIVVAGHTDNTVTPRLEADLHRINFYRLCQQLEKRNPGRPLLGSTSHPADDPVRFAPHPGMGFPASEIKAVEYDEEDDSKPPHIRTTFMGMYGVDSPLPTAYLDDITQRREGHEALQGFLDIFSHRILTQFYRIWRKYSYPATFEPGGTDPISQSLLGLVGLGIPGTAEHIATPVSRFLALLGVLQQPGKTQEGMQALVSLLAPDTTVQVSPYCLRPVAVSQPLGFYGDDDFLLDGNTPLGEDAMDANSQLLIALFTDNEQESQGWKPDGLLYQDFLVMLRVYLGWRFKAKITLTTRTRLLVAPPLGEGPFWLGMNGVLGAQDEYLPEDFPQTFTTELGYYAGLEPASSQQGNRRVTYKFD